MRTSALQYLYLQKPVSTVILLCLISTLPWIASGDFSTKGEPREAAVAVSMLQTGDWTLPRVYADEFAYKPPLAHWLMAVCSLPQGAVSEFTSRLPSALAYTALMAFVMFFWGRKVRFQEAFIATLLLLLCVEIHRAGMTARVDMLLTAFTVIGLIRLYRWEDAMELKGLPLTVPLLLSGAILTKGPAGVVVPLFVFGVYLLLLRKYSLLRIVKSITYAGVASLFIPLLWYIEAWRRGGDDFLQVMMAENFGRFFHLPQTQINYDLGHENGAWYNLVTLAAGLVPWTLLLLLSLRRVKIHLPSGGLKLWLKQWPKSISARLAQMDKTTLFSLVAALCIVFFYSLPSSKRSVYLMPAYPFITLFIARHMIRLAERRAHIVRLFAGILAGVVAAVTLLSVLQLAGAIDLYSLSQLCVRNAATLETFRAVAVALSPGWLPAAVLLLLTAAILTVCYQIYRKIHIKIIYASLFLVFCTNLYIDGVIMTGLRREGSARSFAAQVRQACPENQTGFYVMNNLRQYRNMYGLNFYLGNRFRNFETLQPSSGYLLATEDDYPKIAKRYETLYRFHLTLVSERIISDTKRKIVLCRFEKTVNDER
jgi:4-amino-4-deoxy-L-arabinose transferase-like glycosyltransferase